MKFFIIGFFFLFCILTSTGQNFVVSGKVYDSETGIALPFVNIVVNETQKGTATDIDGKFTIISSEPVHTLHLSYVGYNPEDFAVGRKTENLVIKMTPTEYELSEVIIVPGINPAHRIINNCIDNKRNNDPEKMHAFTYTSYDKMIFTFDLDSIDRQKIDTVSIDTAKDDFREYLKDHHIFIMETVTKRQFLYPDKSNEKVIATHVAGMKDPIFIFAMSTTQSSTFYKNMVMIGSKEYVNPISRGSTKKYHFHIEDTLFNGNNDSIFVISFRPLLKTSFPGLKGVISINSNGWAIQNVIAEPAKEQGMFSFRIQQLYKYVNNEHWFPVQLNTEILLNNVRVTDTSMSIMTKEIPPDDTTNLKFIRLRFGYGKSYIRDIDFHPGLRKRDFTNLTIDVDPNASRRDENFWKKYRTDTLTAKDRNTFEFIDSIGKAAHFDEFAKLYESLLSGKIPIWYFDLDMDKLFGYNSYEGFSLGLGLQTNDRLSQVFKLGGYYRYGFRDKRSKFGAGLDIMLDYRSDFKVSLSYMNDVTETSGTSFFDDDRRLMSPGNFRSFFIEQMDLTKQYKISTEFRTLKYLLVNVAFSKTSKEVTNEYYFYKPGQAGEKQNSFDFTETTLGFRYAYGEKFVRNIRRKISLGTKYPVLHFQYTRGLSGVMNGDFEYNRYDIKIEKSFNTKYFGTTSFTINAGYIDSDIPYTNLYNGRGSYSAFSLFAPVSFATMRMNEFLSNKYVSLFFLHNFKNLLVRSKNWFHPEFAVATNIGFGHLDFKNSHLNIDYKTMDKGFFESGLLINNIMDLKIYNVGLGIFYRYGANHLPRTADNISGRFTINFRF